jgi:hypothetical protein
MRRLGMIASVALLAGILLPVSAAAKPATYTATISDDGACTLVAVGTWPPNVKIPNPLAAWYEDGLDYANFKFSQDSDPAHSNPGIIKKNTVTFTVGPMSADSLSHDWYVRLDFYAPSGALLNQTWSAAHPVNCTV